MERTIGDLRSGKFNVAEGGRALSSEESNRLRVQLNEMDE